MNVLVIPDIHLRKFWRREVFENVDKVDKIVFLGDYFDPYHETDLEDNPIAMMQTIIDLKKNEPDKYILLIGNHECPYIWDDYPRGSRYNMWSAKKYHKLFCDNLDLFNIAYVQDAKIFTHAGITDAWREMCFPELSTLELGKKLASEKLNENAVEFGYLAAISYYRGGYANAGSCVWADIHEHMNPEGPIEYEDCYQVFGHTQVSKPIITNTWACIDCRQGFVIDTLNEITEHTI